VPISTITMRETRHAALQRARQVLDTADAEHRTMTADERDKYDAATREADELRDKIDDAERRNDIEREELLEKSRMEDEHRTSPGPGEPSPVSISADGAEYRTVQPGESYRHCLGHRRSGLSLGKIGIGLATGKWRGAEQEQRAVLSVGLDASGGFSVGTPLSSEIIDLVRNKSAILGNCPTVAMTSNTLRMATWETDPTAEWLQETVAQTASTPTFGAIELQSHTLTALVGMSIELVEDAPNAADQLERALTAAIATEFDRAALRGSGAGAEPVGILNTSGITSTASSSFNYDEVLTVISKLWDNNTQPTHAIYSSTVAEALAKLKDGDGAYMQADMPPSAWTSLEHIVSNQAATTELYVGNLNDMVVGIRTGGKLETFRAGSDGTSNAMTQRLVWFRYYMRGDVALLRPASFSVLTGIS